ncbi:MAG: Uma2 family endonuclease [Planctomycetia bacterium]|nr:Uma2 family endonuclease [Planctomycetia bacterium]
MPMGKTAKLAEPERLVIYGVDWTGYLRFLRAFRDRRGYRLTYDRGVLEIMNVTFGHERYAYLLGRMVVVLTEELLLPIASGGSTTFKRRKKQRGLEPDNCYWITNEHRVRGKERIDLRTDPAPDLAIEVDVTRSSLNRLGIYATLNVPEVWRYRDGMVSFHVLAVNQKYVQQPISLSFPGLAAAEITRFVGSLHLTEENTLIREFRDWVRQQFAAGVLTQPTP